jgi:uncharacterized protein YsxB (DUF464 family)
MQALWVGLTGVLELPGVREIRDAEAPEMGFEWDAASPEAQAIARTIARSLEAIADSYPDNVKYLEIRETRENRQEE